MTIEQMNLEITKANMDKINAQNELETLKTTVKKALGLEYTEYIENDVAGLECSEDNYEALQASLARIFKILKRVGLEPELIK